MAFVLRPYQAEAVDAVFTEFNSAASTILAVPVGGGKTILQASVVQRAIGIETKTRFVCVVHTRELVKQNMEAMLRAWPSAPVGLNSASLGRRDIHSQVLFCSIQSVYRKAKEIGWTDCLIVDECHLISRSATTMFQKFISELRDINPKMKVLGLSGTPYRMDSGSLHEGSDALFETVAYDIGIGMLIDEGFLTRPISKATATGFDIKGVHSRAGDYITKELQLAVNVEETTRSAVQEIIELAGDRKAWIAFCAGVDHAKAVRDMFREYGISSESVDAKTPKGQRDSILRRYKAGEIRCLTNVNILSTGFDYPGIDLVALLRPTKSASLYIQQCGRGLRLSPGKENCLILDFADNIRTLGPLDMVTPKKPKSGDKKGEAPTKVCPQCNEIVALSTMECPDCGAIFPEREIEETPRHAAHAEGDVGILSTEKVPPKRVPVVTWTLSLHPKLNMPDSVRVEYFAGVMTYPEWVSPEHGGNAGNKAKGWWSKHGGQAPFPRTAVEVLERQSEISMPRAIYLKARGKYFDVLGHDFTPEVEVA